MTDVNIAVRLVEDAVDNVFDRAYVVSADVDLLAAIHAVLRRAPKSKLVVLIPPESVVSEEFANLERDYPGRAVARHLDLGKLRRFPDDLPGRWGEKLPPHWRKDSGKRPADPDTRLVSPPGRHVPWYE